LARQNPRSDGVCLDLFVSFFIKGKRKEDQQGYENSSLKLVAGLSSTGQTT
jgi:hypothetical protein